MLEVLDRQGRIVCSYELGDRESLIAAEESLSNSLTLGNISYKTYDFHHLRISERLRQCSMDFIMQVNGSGRYNEALDVMRDQINKGD